MAKRFGSAAAFKASLETRLRTLAAERSTPLSTLQLKLVIERLQEATDVDLGDYLSYRIGTPRREALTNAPRGGAALSVRRGPRREDLRWK